MSGRLLVRVLTAVLGGLLSLALAPAAVAAAPAPTGEVTPMVRTVYYDATYAGEFRTTFNNAASVWNSRVTNVRLVAGAPATVRIYVDDGWPRAYVSGLGRGTIYMGRQAVWQGYYPLRIATHEFGHILGLPDRRTGLCSDLMSGSSAPVSCTNAYPSSAEAAEVNRLFAGYAAATPAGVYSEAPARRRPPTPGHRVRRVHRTPRHCPRVAAARLRTARLRTTPRAGRPSAQDSRRSIEDNGMGDQSGRCATS